LREKKGGLGEKYFMFLHSEMAKKYAKISCEYLASDIFLLQEEADYGYTIMMMFCDGK
jgi:hypothetical protein